MFWLSLQHCWEIATLRVENEWLRIRSVSFVFNYLNIKVIKQTLQAPNHGVTELRSHGIMESQNHGRTWQIQYSPTFSKRGYKNEKNHLHIFRPWQNTCEVSKRSAYNWRMSCAHKVLHVLSEVGNIYRYMFYEITESLILLYSPHLAPGVLKKIGTRGRLLGTKILQDRRFKSSTRGSFLIRIFCVQVPLWYIYTGSFRFRPSAGVTINKSNLRSLWKYELFCDLFYI